MKQSTINSHLSESYKLYDAVTPKVCSGCGRNGVVIHHSHIISQKRCKELGMPELIYTNTEIGYNFVYDCVECHQVWEAVKNPAWKLLDNVFYRNDILKMFDPEGYRIRLGLVS